MRKNYLDNIRWITVCLVVIYHTIYIYNSVQPYGVVGPFREIQYQDAYMYIVYPWFMALLFVVSGVSSRIYLENHTTKEFIKSRTTKLLVPSTIGLFVFGWIQGYFNMQISNAFADISKSVPVVIRYLIMSVSGTGVLWFVQLLWLFSLLLILVIRFEKDKLFNICAKSNVWVLLFMLVPTYLFAQILNTPIITVYRFGIYGFAFFVGYFVFSHDEVIERLVKWTIPLIVAAGVLGVAYTVLYFGENYAMEPTINNVLACVYCYIAILAIFAGFKKWGDKTSKVADFMNRKSWGLYVFHYLPLSIFAYYQSIYFPGMYPIAAYGITLILSFSGALLLYELISRIPLIRWCVLGIKKSSKKDN